MTIYRFRGLPPPPLVTRMNIFKYSAEGICNICNISLDDLSDLLPPISAYSYWWAFALHILPLPKPLTYPFSGLVALNCSWWRTRSCGVMTQGSIIISESTGCPINSTLGKYRVTHKGCPMNNQMLSLYLCITDFRWDNFQLPSS